LTKMMETEGMQTAEDYRKSAVCLRNEKLVLSFIGNILRVFALIQRYKNDSKRGHA